MALVATLVLCGCDGHWEDVEKTTGYKGKARLNPFLAAEELLDGLGHNAHGAKSLTKLPPHDAVILISGEGGLPEGRAKQLLRWAFSGGHLIYCLSGTRPYNDFETQFGSFISAMLLEEEKDPILDQLGVGVQKRVKEEGLKGFIKEELVKKDDKKGETKDGPADKKSEADKDGAEAKPKKKKSNDEEDEDWRASVQEVKWNGETYQVELGGYLHMILKRKLRSGEFSAGNKNESLALHLQHGMGSVTLLSHARPLRNHWIGERDHARWLSDLVGEHGSKEVLFVASHAGSFLGLLWQHGWMALVALGVCIAFWLWQQMPRFGPMAEVELDSTRHFASHIGALGEFFWRMRRGSLLVKSARDAVWERVREKHPSLNDGSRQMSDHLAEEIARRTGLPVNRVTAAFDVAPPESGHNFVNLMRDLQAIRRAL
ncbi:DUF4350 domain-containing protein [Prosthecobacter sp.]|uniref:DUF4350 domain-containing protein n=1 Tax=Prosthecobacter sp. TaxID=1965333 RepID=UPI001DC50223|nr:DUF4350 domain-containing protein [Prosthecobacter sp.]MCB1278603.1 hypothetical protein [Prosthecobacter sp.]